MFLPLSDAWQYCIWCLNIQIYKVHYFSYPYYNYYNFSSIMQLSLVAALKTVSLEHRHLTEMHTAHALCHIFTYYLFNHRALHTDLGIQKSMVKQITFWEKVWLPCCIGIRVNDAPNSELERDAGGADFLTIMVLSEIVGIWKKITPLKCLPTALTTWLKFCWALYLCFAHRASFWTLYSHYTLSQ